MIRESRSCESSFMYHENANHITIRSTNMPIDFSELLAAGTAPKDFEDYLNRYADRVGDLVNAYIPRGAHPDMDR